jgi:hypothetical protein
MLTLLYTFLKFHLVWAFESQVHTKRLNKIVKLSKSLHPIDPPPHTTISEVPEILEKDRAGPSSGH